MDTLQELRSFTRGAFENVLSMQLMIDEAVLHLKSDCTSAHDLDLAARELGYIASTIKDLAYKLAVPS